MLSIHNDSLVARARDGDREAFEGLLAIHVLTIKEHIARSIPQKWQSTLAADDILQDALVKAFLHIPQLNVATVAGFGSWLKAIADLTLIDAIRAVTAQKRGGQLQRITNGQQSASASLADILDLLPANAQTPEREASTAEAIAALQIAIAGLPDDQRRVVTLLVGRHATVKDAAKELNRSPGAIRALLGRAKSQLVESMGKSSAWFSSR